MKKLLILFLSLALFLPSFAAAEEVSILPAEEASTLMEGELLPEGELPEACASEAPTLPEMTPIPAAASENAFRTAGDLLQFWMGRKSFPESAYPDYVTGVWSTDGGIDNLTIGVTKDEAGEAGKEEILSWIEDDSSVTFAYQSYPHRELMKIQGNLVSSLNDETGAYAIGVDEMENRVHIDIDITAPGAAAFMEECFAAYGDRIEFEEGEGISITTETIGAIDPGGALTTGLMHETGYEKPNLLPLVFFVSLLLLAAGGWMFLKNRRGRAAVTAEGDTVSAAPITDAAIKAALRESGDTPPPSLDEKILAAAEKEIQGK